MKRLICAFMALVISMYPAVNTLATSTSDLQVSAKTEVSILTGQILTETQSLQIKSEMETLNYCHVDTSYIEKINVTANGNEYLMNYNGILETVVLEENDSGSVSLMVNAGEKCDVLTFEEDGSLILDGHKVEITEVTTTENNSDIEPRGTIWKGTKSLSPYGSLKASDYNDYLSSGTQNISLGKALDAITVTVLSTILGQAYGYIGIAVSLATMAASVISTLSTVNAKTEYLGYKYTTYTHGAFDYKYINKFYANTACTGTYHQEISYEHFIVY